MTMIHGLLPEDRSDDLDAVVRAGALAAVLRALADPTPPAPLSPPSFFPPPRPAWPSWRTWRAGSTR